MWIEYDRTTVESYTYLPLRLRPLDACFDVELRFRPLDACFLCGVGIGVKIRVTSIPLKIITLAPPW